jgi:hypothetical protein
MKAGQWAIQVNIIQLNARSIKLAAINMNVKTFTNPTIYKFKYAKLRWTNRAELGWLG